jgi:O-antigen/teichoic acid export membrane protein
VLPKYLSTLTAYVADFNRGPADFTRRVTSPLYVNSLYLLASTVASSALGFVFWLLAARATNAADIGIATAAIASVNLLMALCDLGLATALIYYAAIDRAQTTTLVNTIVATGWLCITITATVFLAGMRFWSPGLAPIGSEGTLVVVFIGYAAFNYILSLQDATMLSQGRASYVLWRNLACNVPSVLLLLPLAYLVGGYGSLFLAYGLPNIVVGVFVGLAVLPLYIQGYRFFGHIHRPTLTKIAAYGLANHTGNILWGIPAYVLPLIAVNTLTAEQTGYFFICWTIANFALIVPRMVTFSLFAEGSQNRSNLRSSSLHALLLILVLVVPVICVLWVWGDDVLGLFGRAYVNLSLLHLLLLSVVPFAINSIYFVVLRVQRRLKQIILFSILISISILTLASTLVRAMGAEGLAMGWLLGHSLAAIIACAISAWAILVKGPLTPRVEP